MRTEARPTLSCFETHLQHFQTNVSCHPSPRLALCSSGRSDCHRPSGRRRVAACFVCVVGVRGPDGCWWFGGCWFVLCAELDYTLRGDVAAEGQGRTRTGAMHRRLLAASTAKMVRIGPRGYGGGGISCHRGGGRSGNGVVFSSDWGAGDAIIPGGRSIPGGRIVPGDR